MDPKCWIKLREPRSKSPSRGVIVMIIVLFLAVLTCLMLVILLQEISSLRTELANVHKELHAFNKRREHFRVISMQPGDLSETLNKQNESIFQRKEKLSGLNRNSEELRGLTRRRRNVGQCRQLSFLQLSPNAERSTIQQEDSTFIPWIVASQRGAGLEKKLNKILVKEEGYYSVYSQVLYFDNCMAMGHVVRRKKSHLVGNEQRLTTLFRCIQNMPNNTASNTCFTAGIVKLDQGDELELLLPSRPNAQISMDGDSTFFGAIQVL
uniref:B cell activating factor n=1 Tax=Callorhinchus milii TaxID=7868 RepID=V9KYZ4_CALMI|nr:tumor necrosis factor ligand superfamily member 13C [Callorhinchus milii]